MIKKNSISLVRLGYSDITSLTVRICSDILEKSFKDNDYSTKRNAVYLALEKKKKTVNIVIFGVELIIKD